MSTFRNGLSAIPYGMTENGARMYESTGNKCLDMFALGASMRNRSDEDCVQIFKKAYKENPNTALQILWYIGDVRNGQGERRFFRVCYDWLLRDHKDTALTYLDKIPAYKRYDDMIYIADKNIMAWNKAIDVIDEQLKKDIKNMAEGKPISLLAKWLPSQNASNKETKRLGRRVAHSLFLTYREYRKILSKLRSYLNIVETNLTDRTYNNIVYEQVPSKANIKYGSAFAKNDYERYNAFIKDNKREMKMSVTYPYEIVNKVEVNHWSSSHNNPLSDDVVNKMWANLPDYLNGDNSNTICVVDTSGSMYGTPLDVACSLGLYFGERNRGPFKDCFISFSSRPKFIEFADGTFADKVRDIYRQNLCENTNIEKVFDLLLNVAKRPTTKKEDIPENVLIISDMEFDQAQSYGSDFMSTMDSVRAKWEAAGLEMPHLIFWNVDARQNNLPVLAGPVSFVSGMSPVIFNTIITGKTGEDLMKETLKPYSNFVAID